jgi:hypothetical protein
MPDGAPDYRTPSHDAGHEAIRAPLAAAVDQLAEQIGRIDNAFYLLLSTAGFAQGTLNTVQAGQVAIGQLQLALVSMAARVTDIEARLPPPAEPTATPPP